MGLFSFGRKSNNDPRITVRLQVWHYHARGRCPDFNRELASFFTPKDLLKNWTVHPAKVVEPPDISSRDEYVPVEVDFVHKRATYVTLVGDPQSSVRDIFKHLAPAIVYKYFVIDLKSAPHAMNIYPTRDGEEITEADIKMQYAHSFILHPYELRLHMNLEARVVSQQDTMVEIIGAIDLTLDNLRALVCAYMVFQGGSVSTAGEVLATTSGALQELTSQLPWLKNALDKARAAERGDAAVPRSSDVADVCLVPMRNAANSFEQLRDLAIRIEPRLTRLSNGEGLTNQGIVDTMLDLRQAMVHLSEYEKLMQVVENEEFTKWDQKASAHRMRQWAAAATGAIGVAALVLALFFKPDMLGELLHYQIGGGVVAAGGFSGSYAQKRLKDKALVARQNAKTRARKGRIALQGVKKALEEVRTDMATIYMTQVLRQSPDENLSMGRHELEKMVRMLGGDLSLLDKEGYSRALIGDRMRNLVERSQELNQAFQKQWTMWML